VLARNKKSVTCDLRVAAGGDLVRRSELDDAISAWTARYDADGLLELLHAAGVPAGRTYRAQDMLRDPHFAARSSIIRVPDRHFGELAMQNVFPRLSATPGSVRWTGPDLGEHNAEVYGGLLGLAPADIDALRTAGVI
jgi:formyl-CoA transferase